MPRRSVRAVVLVLAMLTVGAASACSRDDRGADPEKVAAPRERLAPTCPAPSTRASIPGAAQVNAIVSAADLPQWQAGDIGASARLTDGRLVWVFGDTVRKASFSPRIAANSMLVTSRTCVSQVITSDDGPIIPDVTSGTVYWPMSIAVLRESGRDVLLIMCSRIKRGNGANDLDFTYLGSSAAVFQVKADGSPTLVKVERITPDDTSKYQINWGAASTIDGRWLYVYGTRLTKQPYVVGRELYVARVPVDDPGDRSGWRFWDGTAWQSDRGKAAATLPADGGVSQTLSVDKVGKRFVAVSKKDGDLADFVYTWTADRPTGPFRPRQSVSAPAGFDTGDLEYAPLAHPEITLDSGNLLVSISRNTTDLNKLLSQPEVGRPEFVEVARPH